MVNATEAPLPWAPAHYLQLDAVDDIGYDMKQHCAAVSAFVSAARAFGGCCLVHCQAGINRSGFLVAAEVMVGAHLPVLEAVRRCKRARGCVLLSNVPANSNAATSEHCPGLCDAARGPH